jgi:hypothetical protein
LTRWILDYFDQAVVIGISSFEIFFDQFFEVKRGQIYFL